MFCSMSWYTVQIADWYPPVVADFCRFLQISASMFVTFQLQSAGRCRNEDWRNCIQGVLICDLYSMHSDNTGLFLLWCIIHVELYIYLTCNSVIETSVYHPLFHIFHQKIDEACVQICILCFHKQLCMLYKLMLLYVVFLFMCTIEYWVPLCGYFNPLRRYEETSYKKTWKETPYRVLGTLSDLYSLVMMNWP